MIRTISKRILATLLTVSISLTMPGMSAYAMEEDSVATAASSSSASIEASDEASTELSSSRSDTEKHRGSDDAANSGSDEKPGDAANSGSDEKPDDAASSGSSDKPDEPDEASSLDSEEKTDESDEAASLGSSEETGESDEAASLESSEDALVTAGYDSNEPILEFHVAPGYEGVYTEDDIEEYLRSKYSDEELCPEYDPDDEILVTASASGLRGAMKARKTSYSYSSSSFNPAKDIANAEKDVDETDPTGGDYIKGNLIGYSANGSSSGGSYSINLKLIWASYGNPANEEKEVTQKVAQIVTDLELDSETLSEFEKLTRIHEYLVDTIKYDDDQKFGCHGSYAALINQKCVCQGYANAFTRLTREAGLASKYITGMEINHAWNLVRVYGGTDPERPWYNMDVTWSGGVDYDDPDTYTNGWFLLNDIDFTRHPRDKEYESDSYVSAHPISRYSWGRTDAGNLNAENYDGTFTTLEGKTVSIAAEGKPKFIIFYRTTCYSSQTVIKSLAGSNLLKKNKVDVLALNIDGESQETIQKFANTYAKGAKISFAVGDENDVLDLLDKYRLLTNQRYVPLSPPFIALIDEHNKFQFHTDGIIHADKISKLYMPYLKDYWDPDADTKSVEIRKYKNAEDVTAGSGTVVKNKGTVRIKFGEEIYLLAKSLPNKEGIADFTEATTPEVTDVSGAISYDPATGRLEGIGKGTATIVFASDYNDDVKSTVKITVAAAPITGISFDRSLATLKMTDTLELTLSHLPAKTTDDVAGAVPVITSSDEGVVKIAAIEKTTGESGSICKIRLEPVSIGSATITAKCLGKTTTARVTVINPVTDFSFENERESEVVFAGERVMLTALTEPWDATMTSEFDWKISGNAEYTIDRKNGGNRVAFTATAPGTFEIELSLKDVPDQHRSYSLKVLPADLILDPCGGDLGEEKRVRPGSYGRNVGPLPIPARSGYIFMGWYTEKDCAGKKINENTLLIHSVFKDSLKAYAGWKEISSGVITIAPIADYVYNGNAIKPDVTVYYGSQPLKAGRDYSVSYKNNKNAFTLSQGEEGFKDAKGKVLAPTVIVKGKGNYKGTSEAYFKIQKRNLDYGITIDDKKLNLTYNGKKQMASPTVKFGKTTLKPGKDYTLDYGETYYETHGDYTMPGFYQISIRATPNGNFASEISCLEHIARKDLTPIGKCSISCPKSLPYTGSGIIPDITVKSGKTVLVKDIDYTVNATDNVEIGTASVVVNGIGACTGTKKLTFKIKGTSISKSYVTLDESSFAYDGEEHSPLVSVKLKKTDKDDLVQGVDYKVSYSNNLSKGKATAVVTGIGKYTGTVKKTYNITAVNVADLAVTDVDGREDISTSYLKGGAMPQIRLTYMGKELEQGTDYTVKASNNNKLYDLTEKDAGFNAKKAPVLTVTGKGNFSGKRKVFFTVTASQLQDDPKAVATAGDVIYNTKAGKWKSAVTVLDSNGKKLSAGTDYEKAVTYTYVGNASMTDGSTREDGAEVLASDSPAAGTKIRAIIKGIGAYDGTVLETTYRIIAGDKNIASGITFKISDQVYKGDYVTITKDNITVTPSASRAGFTVDDLEIVEGSYKANFNKGTAKVTVHGLAPYGGTKVLTFKIGAKEFK